MLYDEGCCLYLSKNIVEIFHEPSTSAESKYEKKFSYFSCCACVL